MRFIGDRPLLFFFNVDHQIKCQMDSTDDTTYDTTENESQEPSYNSQSLWGNTFVQGNEVGLGSYHFVKANDEKGAYISYESSKTTRWGTLDNGSPLPPRVCFRNAEFIEDILTFHGFISWEDDFSTSLNGCTKWEFEMVFDEEFTKIKGGGVRNFLKNGEEGPFLKYKDMMKYKNAYN